MKTFGTFNYGKFYKNNIFNKRNLHKTMKYDISDANLTDNQLIFLKKKNFVSSFLKNWFWINSIITSIYQNHSSGNVYIL